MCDSALGGGGCLVLEDGTKQPRPPKTKKRVRPVSIRFTPGMAPIVGHLLDILGRLDTPQKDALRELTGTATR